MLQRFRNSPWVGAVVAMCAILWEGFWLIGPPLGIVKAERPLYLFWGVVALSVAAFQSFYTFLSSFCVSWRTLRANLYARSVSGKLDF
jgi:hypothetical protein